MENSRHELKYPIGFSDYIVLRGRLQAVLRPDSHAGADGTYGIRSIYFDNYRDKALREKIDGVSYREKFRIRYYNDDLSFITLEKKVKDGTLCHKYDVPLTERQCRRILAGDITWMRNAPEPLLREFYRRLREEQLRPRVLVSYRREAYVYAPGNVRVTFDSDVRTSLFHQTFLERKTVDIPAADRPWERILEVKYDSFFPAIIADLLQCGGIRQEACSKYGLCRRFG